METKLFEPPPLSLHLPSLSSSTANFTTRTFISFPLRNNHASFKSLAHNSASPHTDPVEDNQHSQSSKPIYSPTPPNRQLRTPHSGYAFFCSHYSFKLKLKLVFFVCVFRYHFDGTARKFFEGWYFKVSIPEKRQSFCFMYSVENPAFRKPLTTFELAQYGPRFTGVGAQILGADDKYICQYTPESHNFWGSKQLVVVYSCIICVFFLWSC